MILLETSVLAIAFGQKTRRRAEPKAVGDLRQMIADDWPLAMPGIVLQIAHMGYMDELDMIGAISALELVLAEMGWNVQPGTTVMAAQQAFSETEGQ